MRKRHVNSPIITFIVVTVWQIARLLPLNAARDFLSFVVGSFAELLTNQNKIRGNLAVAFPELSSDEIAALGRAIAANFGRMVAELIHMADFGQSVAREDIRILGEDILEKLDRGSAIFVGPHVGNWELPPLLLEQRGIKLTIIHSSIGNPTIDQVLLKARRKTGATYVERANALRAIYSAIQTGHSVAFLVDQKAANGVEVEFFGRPTSATNLPARLAMRFDCPIVPVETIWHGRQVHIIFAEPIHARENGRLLTEHEITQRMMKAVEENIRRNPDIWFCNTRRWRRSIVPNEKRVDVSSAPRPSP